MHAETYKQEGQSLSTTFLTKEFPGFEVESKWQLLTENPVPTILRFVADIHAGKWCPIQIAKSMGKLPVGLRYFELQFDFWAIPSNPESSHYRQVAMVAVVPGTYMHQVAFKEGGTVRLLSEGWGFLNPPLIRREERKGNWVGEQEAVTLVLNRFPNAEKVAVTRRQKCYVYIHNTETYRNFSVSSDLCQYGSGILSQVEVEYKGRNGLWLPDITGHQIALDFQQIHEILDKWYGDILIPSTQTKFEWLQGG